MRRVRLLLWALVFAALAAAPSHATSITVVMTGTWDSVTDNAGVTNGTIVNGGSFTVTLSYDDSAADTDPGDVTVGSYTLPGATTSLTLSTGSYTFSLLGAEDVLFGVSDDWFGQDDFAWFAENFSTSGPLPIGVTTGYGYMNPLVVDSTQTAHSSDALTDLPWEVGDYDSPNQGMYFLIAVNGAGPNKKIELFGDFTSFSVLPEPSLGPLWLVAGGALFALRRRG